MSLHTLINVVQAYLQADRYHQDCVSRGMPDPAAEQRVREARRELEAHVEAHTPAAPARTVLVAVSDLDNDAAAVDMAGMYARMMGARVVLMHVLAPTMDSAPETGCPSLDTMAFRHTGAETMLAHARRRLDAGLEVTTLVRDGAAPARAVIAEAEQINADLIIVGERRGGRLAHLLMPDTVHAIIHGAPCPVLSVNRQARPQHAIPPAAEAPATA